MLFEQCIIKDIFYFADYNQDNEMMLAVAAAVFTISCIQLVLSQCPQNCHSCSITNHCLSCKVGYWATSLNCNYKCSNNCTDSKCDDKGYCYSCVDGMYGPNCNQECQLCMNGDCGPRECTSGCKSGYFQDIRGDYSYCSPCPVNCQQCLNSTYCTLCDTGYYVNKYTFDFEPRRGTASCIVCEYSTVCDDCSKLSNCTQCSFDGVQTTCEHCSAGYTLNNHQCVKNIVCSAQNDCLNGCRANGECNGCIDGKTGITCGYRCNYRCSKCLQTNQDMCEACIDGYYTSTCDISCSQNCANRQCDFNNGSCLNGCLSGLWGEKCEDKCSDHCTQLECNKDGTCSRGCTAEYDGLYCNITITTTVTESTLTTTSRSGNETTTSSLTTITTTARSLEENTLRNEQADSQLPVAAIGGGVGGGVVFLTVVVVVIVCIVKRRQRKKKEDTNGLVIGSGEASNPVFDPEINNSESSHPTTTQPVDYIYAQPNKPKKQVINTASPEDPNDKTYSNTKIDINEKDAGEETDTDEAVELEDLDDGEADVIAAEAEAPSTDTYYNTVGLKRSRIQVSKLLGYIQGKSDFQSEFERLPKKLTRSCNEALKPPNRAKNRYNGVYSYDATRVVLRSKEYINASHIEGYNNSKAYIASLGPTKSTMPQFAVFWEMVWQEKTQKIVMLTNLMETGKMKCDQYWPDNGSSKQYGSISVTAKAEHVYAEFVIRELQVLHVKAAESRTVTQYHYTAWPDKSVPDTVVSLVEFRDIVEKKRTPNAGPMIVHCSAGIGRTGTYIALDTLINEGKAENSVDIFGCVNALRGQRVHMVQNVEQYVFLHHCVVYALTCQPGSLDVSSLTSYTRDDNMNAQFQALKNLPLLANKDSDSFAINTKRKENRKGSDIPGDHHRVKLTGTKKDFINAVFVDGYLQTDRYILAQTPMPSTLEDFLSLLYQEKIGLIVCLDEEDGKDKTIGQYVAPANKVFKIGHFTVSTVSCESSEGFVVRTLKVSKIGKSNANELNIRHYHFQGWTNTDSVPESLHAFMSLITAVNKHCRSESGTLLFHCLDGATKSSLLCAVAIMLEKLAVERELSVINTICHVRGRRRRALQEFDQFKFCYNCVREHLETSEAKAYYNIL